jgi:membrane protein DedA with SNARE-associated domain
MDNILQTLTAFTAEYPATTSYILAGGIILQGDLAVLFAMLLIVGGALTWGKFFSVALGTLAAGELLLYFGGRIIRNTRFGWRWYMKTRENRRIQYYSYYITQNLTKLMIAARFLVGVNFLVLLLAGWSRTKFGPFLKSYLVGLLSWFFTVTAIAYFLMTGLSYLKTEHVFRQIEILIVVVIALFFVGELVIRKFLRKKMEIETSAEKMGRFIEEKMKMPGE